jgi:hypothetical protein
VGPDQLDAEKLGVPAEFLGQFQVPTRDEMVADGVVMDGGHKRTLIKVGTGNSNSYRVISQLYGLGLASNATLGFPTLESFTDVFGNKWQYTGELAVACQLGAVTNSFFIRRTAVTPEHGEQVAWAFAEESVQFARQYGIVATAASIGDGPMAERCLRMGSHIVATPPHKVGKDIWDFIRWLAEQVPQIEAESPRIALPQERKVVSYADYLDSGFNTIPSPLVAAGYKSFISDHIKSAWVVAQFIQSLASRGTPK